MQAKSNYKDVSEYIFFTVKKRRSRLVIMGQQMVRTMKYIRMTPKKAWAFFQYMVRTYKIVTNFETCVFI